MTTILGETSRPPVNTLMCFRGMARSWLVKRLALDPGELDSPHRKDLKTASLQDSYVLHDRIKVAYAIGTHELA
jgi:hypothetical protein